MAWKSRWELEWGGGQFSRTAISKTEALGPKKRDKLIVYKEIGKLNVKDFCWIQEVSASSWTESRETRGQKQA